MNFLIKAIKSSLYIDFFKLTLLSLLLRALYSIIKFLSLFSHLNNPNLNQTTFLSATAECAGGRVGRTRSSNCSPTKPEQAQITTYSNVLPTGYHPIASVLRVNHNHENQTSHHSGPSSEREWRVVVLRHSSLYEAQRTNRTKSHTTPYQTLYSTLVQSNNSYFRNLLSLRSQ